MYSKETCLQHKLQKPWAKNLINATFYTPVRSSSHCRIIFPRPNLKGCLHKFVHFPKILYFIQNIICSKLFVFGIVAMQPKSGDHLKTYLGEIFVIKYKKNRFSGWTGAISRVAKHFPADANLNCDPTDKEILRCLNYSYRYLKTDKGQPIHALAKTSNRFAQLKILTLYAYLTRGGENKKGKATGKRKRPNERSL